MSTPHVHPDTLAMTADMYLSGLSIRAVARKLRLSYTAVHHRLVLAGVQMRPVGAGKRES
jgi:hypothetical protein